MYVSRICYPVLETIRCKFKITSRVGTLFLFPVLSLSQVDTENSLWLWTISYISAKHSSLTVPVPLSCFSSCSEKPGFLSLLPGYKTEVFQLWQITLVQGKTMKAPRMEENRGNSACGHLLTLMWVCYFLMCGTGVVLLHVPKSYLPIKVLSSLRSGTVRSLS